jgi:hypothetical protein
VISLDSDYYYMACKFFHKPSLFDFILKPRPFGGVMYIGYATDPFGLNEDLVKSPPLADQIKAPSYGQGCFTESWTK